MFWIQFDSWFPRPLDMNVSENQTRTKKKKREMVILGDGESEDQLDSHTLLQRMQNSAKA